MEKSRIVWAEEIERERSNSNPISSSPRPKCKLPAPLEPVMSKTERKTRERWRNAEVSNWLDRENKKEYHGYNELFEMEL